VRTSEIIYITMIAIGSAVLIWCTTHRRPPALKPWPISAADFLQLSCSTLLGAFLFPQFAVALFRRSSPANPAVEALLRQACYDAGILLGIIVGLAAIGPTGFFRHRKLLPSGGQLGRSLFAGLVTFLASLPLTLFAGKIWERLLALIGIPTQRQEQFDVLSTVKSPARFAAWVAVIAIAAPIAEELIFRAGLFRFLRARLPRWAALSLPSALFAAQHISFKSPKGLAALAPLFVLGLVWSLAYERTGTILVSIVAHCLTNLAAVAFFTISK